MQNYSGPKENLVKMKIPSVTFLKRKERILMPRSRAPSQHSTMSNKTKNFLQKICYKSAASVDMTRYGFVNDRILHPVNLMMKPFKSQLAKIMGKPTEKIIIPRRRVASTRHIGPASTFSRRSLAQQSITSRNLSTTSRRKTSSSVQANPDYIIRSRKRWG